MTSSSHDCGTRHPRGVGLRGAGWLIERTILDERYRFSLFSNDVRSRPAVRLVMRFLACLLATAVLLPASNASPTSILSRFFSFWSESLNLLRWKPSLKANDTVQFEKRQSDTAFDHNPDGSQFLWVLQDTYQGETFFEYVDTRRANEVR